MRMHLIAVPALTLAVLLGIGSASFAQGYYVASPPAVVTVPAPVVNYSYYPPATTVYSAPAPVFAAPAPAVSYSYYPSTTVYSAPAPVVAAPTVVYSAPAVVQTPPPGVYTTRTYNGLGIFRPRGTYTQTYYTPWGVR